MNLASIRIITADIKKLVSFYETVTELRATWLTDEFAEVATPSCTLALGTKRTMDMFGAGAAHPADNRTAILEFRVADVDRDFARLRPVVGAFAQEPTTQPWGNRSVLFRDPEGNLVNLFTPVTDAAKKRFGL